MKKFAIIAPFLAAGCMTVAPVETPERAVRSFNGATVTLQSKTPAPTADDLAMARSVCPGARYTSTLFRVEGVSEYLFTC